MLHFTCPACKKSLKAPDNAAGKTGKCPGCGTPVQFPSRPAAPPPSEASPPAAGEPLSPPGAPAQPRPAPVGLTRTAKLKVWGILFLICAALCAGSSVAGSPVAAGVFLFLATIVGAAGLLDALLGAPTAAEQEAQIAEREAQLARYGGAPPANEAQAAEFRLQRGVALVRAWSDGGPMLGGTGGVYPWHCHQGEVLRAILAHMSPEDARNLVQEMQASLRKLDDARCDIEWASARVTRRKHVKLAAQFLKLSIDWKEAGRTLIAEAQASST